MVFSRAQVGGLVSALEAVGITAVAGCCWLSAETEGGKIGACETSHRRGEFRSIRPKEGRSGSPFFRVVSAGTLCIVVSVREYAPLGASCMSERGILVCPFGTYLSAPLESTVCPVGTYWNA